ncbi:MAG: DUF2235 domain-containing protein, partial [Hyphomicrobiales bacterium]|nr:DUF2235 domain-containing protein [Hyphomicrobiales bacterium]
IRMWEPGDRIFLFGFSRGAYTVRCLAAALGQCGVPTQMPDGSPLRRDVSTSTRIAREAVKHIYQHVSSPNDKAYVPQRVALAQRFRTRYGSDHDGGSNAIPFFIGVFDTVASLGSKALTMAMIAGGVLAVFLVSVTLSFFLFPLWPTFGWLLALAFVLTVIGYIWTHLKYARNLDGYTVWQTVHLVAPKMQFYDLHLNNAVWYARHAMSIDENRADFARVPWGGVHNTGPVRPDEYPDWLQQIWFAGNHSDIGGSYPENESRLSDISLEWMTHAAKNLPDGNAPDGFGIKVDERYLQLNPDPLGPQHDEREPGWFGGRFRWPEGFREVQPEADLHSTVLERFASNGGVQHYYERSPYRPPNLSGHSKVKHYYVEQPSAPDPSLSATSSLRTDREWGWPSRIG